MAGAAYYRNYRLRIKSDPQRAARYAAKDRERKARNRAIPGWRAAHEPDRRCRAVYYEPIPPLHTGHPLLDEARERVPAWGTLTTLYDPLVEDLRSEYVLAVLEGRDPMEAVRKYRNADRSLGRRCCPLLLE